MKQNQLLEKINNVNTSLAKLSRREKRSKLIKIRHNKSDVRTSENQETLKTHLKELYPTKFEKSQLHRYISKYIYD